MERRERKAEKIKIHPDTVVLSQPFLTTPRQQQGVPRAFWRARGYSATVAVHGPPDLSYISDGTGFCGLRLVESCSEQIRAAWSIHVIMALQIRTMVLLTWQCGEVAAPPHC